MVKKIHKVLKDKIIQGLFSPDKSDGHFWYLLARVSLSKFIEKE